MSEVIKKGYQIQVTSWENDGDNYRTKIVSGLTREQARMYYQLCKFFTSCHHEEVKGFGNAGVVYEKNHHDINEGRFHPEGFYEKFKEFCELYAIDTYLLTPNTFYELIGTWCDGEFVRVVDSIKIFCIPDDCIEHPLHDFEVY